MGQFIGFILGGAGRPEFQFLNAAGLDFMQKFFIADNEIFAQRDEVVPDIIFVVQSYPDQFSSNFIYRVRQRWLMTPIILLLGAGNCGERRTGQPLEGCFRIYVHDWNDFWYGQLKNYADNKKSVFDLPPTCEDDEIFLEAAKYDWTAWTGNVSQRTDNISQREGNISQDNCNVPQRTGNVLRDDCCLKGGEVGRVCLIVSGEGNLGNDYAMNRFLAEYASSRGYRCEFDWRRLSRPPELVIIDVDDSEFVRIIESVQRLRCVFADSEFNVCINSPRFGELLELERCGVGVVMSKPFFWC
ncbi:MAG: hypothetical protein LBT09_00075 [Planctomycetaceae bacterium]|jgi:hypothetical protein|nr:hypothetical protein [Planctomycetaceae bacterium]